VLAATSAAFVAGACGDPVGLRATLATQTDTFVAFALTGTDPARPAAINTLFRSVVRVDNTFNFDVAFDLDPAGGVRLLPVTMIGGLATANRRVGIRKSEQPFDALTRAPGDGFTYDSATVVQPGEAVSVQVTNGDQCAFSLSPFIYSRIGIDSINPATRAIYFRATNDPNCGFRSFLPGVPRN
jgi:hypothetical protein